MVERHTAAACGPMPSIANKAISCVAGSPATLARLVLAVTVLPTFLLGILHGEFQLVRRHLLGALTEAMTQHRLR